MNRPAPRAIGTMLWFNADKGVGLLLTEDDVRLPVSLDDFASGTAPEGRCRGRDVTFELVTVDGVERAVGIDFPTVLPQRRARMRHSR